MRKALSIISGFIILGLLGYIGYLVVVWLAAALQDVDSTVGAAIIASAATIISSVSIASYNARKARERVAFEAHREKKAEIYNEFMDVVVEIMRNTKSGKDGDDVLPEDVQEFFFRFTSRVTVYGGPGVVKAYGAWRSSYSGDNSPAESKPGLLLIDSLFREMRADLGESNKGIGKHELLGLFIIGVLPRFHGHIMKAHTERGGVSWQEEERFQRSSSGRRLGWCDPAVNRPVKWPATWASTPVY